MPRSVRILFCSTLLLPALLAGGCGGGEGETSQESPPRAESQARLLTLTGSRESAGLHWILIGDGFTAEQQEELRAAAVELSREMLDTPELAGHTSVWNVHLLQYASREAGVDDPAAGRFVDTAFDGTLGCGSNSRLACVDWARIQDALQAERAPQAQLTVILNTGVYVGSSNSSGIVVSRNENARRIVVHEMGHRVAGLADEYVDDVVAGEWLPLYVEGRFPNVTRQSSAEQAPWRHWLDDSARGVGLFEGAFYIASGFYRAKQDSLMRTLDAPLGEVNAEAWLRAQYRSLPPLSSASPADPQVPALAGDTVQFSVVSAWPRGTVELRWRVDGVEVAGSIDASRFSFAADGLPHQVDVTARDVTGRIRAPDAGEATARRAWTVSPEAVRVSHKASVAAPATWLQVSVGPQGHQVRGRLEAPPSATSAFAPHAQAHWRYTLLDGEERVLAAGDLTDPRIAWTALPQPGQAQAGHVTALLDSGVYYVGIPQGASARKLRIAATAAGMEKLGLTGALPAGAVELELDSP
jgi:hypothetical protein